MALAASLFLLVTALIAPMLKKQKYEREQRKKSAECLRRLLRLHEYGHIWGDDWWKYY